MIFMKLGCIIGKNGLECNLFVMNMKKGFMGDVD